jgi:hypothetical protein
MTPLFTSAADAIDAMPLHTATHAAIQPLFSTWFSRDFAAAEVFAVFASRHERHYFDGALMLSPALIRQF